MRWKRIEKDEATIPAAGNYKNWKAQLAEESSNQCVYCSIHEGRFGGERNFHVEHFRPQSKFRNLENSYLNLFYACSICNSFKGNDWPNEPCDEHSRVGYVDPSKTNYNAIFNVVQNRVVGALPAPKYMIERLYLNRPQLILERRLFQCEQFIASLCTRIAQTYSLLLQVDIAEEKALLMERFAKLMILQSEIMKNMAVLHQVSPYTRGDVSRC